MADGVLEVGLQMVLDWLLERSGGVMTEEKREPMSEEEIREYLYDVGLDDGLTFAQPCADGSSWEATFALRELVSLGFIPHPESDEPRAVEAFDERKQLVPAPEEIE